MSVPFCPNQIVDFHKFRIYFGISFGADGNDLSIFIIADDTLYFRVAADLLLTRKSEEEKHVEYLRHRQTNGSLPRNALNRWRLARHQERVGSATKCSPNVERYHQFLLMSVVRLSLGWGHVHRALADVVVIIRYKSWKLQLRRASGLAGGRNMVMGFEIRTRVDSGDNCGPVKDPCISCVKRIIVCEAPIDGGPRQCCVRSCELDNSWKFQLQRPYAALCRIRCNCTNPQG
jgi:hypothetical protein